jgi:hypothetical protein
MRESSCGPEEHLLNQLLLHNLNLHEGDKKSGVQKKFEHLILLTGRGDG